MIEIQNLTRQYGSIVAVDDLNCTIEAGKIYGLLGVNGAGKTTTINMIAGALAPTSGSIRICGSDLAADPIAAKQHIGYLPEIPPLYPDLTVREYLSFAAKAKGVPKEKLPTEIASALQKTRLTEVSNRLIRNLSKGYCQRVGIAQAVLNNPNILILDEPTVGLDPVQIVEIRELIRSLSRSHTVILSSHILTEVAELCDMIMILSAGRLVAMDSLANLQKEYLGPDLLHFTVKCSAKKCEEVLRGISGLQKLRMTEQSGLTRGTVECAKGFDLREAVFFAFSAIRCPILEMQLQEASLEDVFLRATVQPGGLSAQARPSDSANAPVGRREKKAPPKKAPSKQPSPPAEPQKPPQTASSTPSPVEEEEDEDYIPLFGKKENRK